MVSGAGLMVGFSGGVGEWLVYTYWWVSGGFTGWLVRGVSDGVGERLKVEFSGGVKWGYFGGLYKHI